MESSCSVDDIDALILEGGPASCLESARASPVAVERTTSEAKSLKLVTL
jgi:hypothetical protein